MASAQVDGFRLAFAVGAGFALAGAAIALVLLRVRREDAIAGATHQAGQGYSRRGRAGGWTVWKGRRDVDEALDVKAAARGLEAQLRDQGRPQRAAGEKAYLKSDLDFYGATVPQIRRAVKAFRSGAPNLAHDDLIGLVQALWARPVHECRSAAITLLELYQDKLRPGDATLIERMLRESRTWALVDDLSASVMGPLVERCPELADTLDRWARDDDFWLRRSALLALLLALRRGEGDFARFGRYADAMLEEREFFIRKAIGWVLRDTASKRPTLVADWLRSRTQRVSGLTLRAAVKPLPAETRDQLLAGREAARRRGRGAAGRLSGAGRTDAG
jgi:3-methyladenine DNA glycosylase AlkD